jgi:hypothetical protein
VVTKGTLKQTFDETNYVEVINDIVNELKDVCIQKYNEEKSVPPVFILIAKNGEKVLVLQPNFNSLDSKIVALDIVQSIIENNGVQCLIFATEAYWKEVKNDEEAEKVTSLSNDDDASEAVIITMTTEKTIETKFLPIKRIDGTIATEFVKETVVDRTGGNNKGEGRMNDVYLAVTTPITKE